LVVVNSLEGPVRDEAFKAFGHAFKVLCLRAVNFPPIWKRLRDLLRTPSKWEFHSWGSLLGISLGDWCGRVARYRPPKTELERFVELEDELDQLRRDQSAPSASALVASLASGVLPNSGVGLASHFYIRLFIEERLDKEIEEDPSRYESWEKTELRHRLRAIARSVSEDL